MSHSLLFLFFFLNDPATPEIYPLPLHAALPICHYAAAAPRGPSRRSPRAAPPSPARCDRRRGSAPLAASQRRGTRRSEEHTSELQSPCNLVCRLLLEKKKSSRPS